ncbi:MAG: DUF4252 domain-containing protein [Opitutales bacterium]|nr:DUF4252 domain-containing protein [Opitutales bacterium]
MKFLMKDKEKFAVRGASLFLALICLSTMTGCFGVNGQFVALRDLVLKQTDGAYETEAEFKLGGFILGIASKIVSMADDPDAATAKEILDKISAVQIGAYQLESHSWNPDLVYPRVREMANYMLNHGYDAIVRSYERDNCSLIMVKSDFQTHQSIREIVVLNLEPDALQIVQLSGEIGGIIDTVIREREVPGLEDATEDI